LPESNSGVVEVAVWTYESLFVQQTVAPTVTVADAGSKAKLSMLISVSPA